MEKVAILKNINTEEKTVSLNMASGEQIVEPSENKSMSKVTITKPSTLIPTNIIEGVNIGGVVGTIKVYPTYEESAELDMKGGDQYFYALEGKLMTKVTIYRDPDLIPENIKKGVVIGGVEGIHDPQVGYEERTVTPSGTMTIDVTSSEGKFLSKVTVEKVNVNPHAIMSGCIVADVAGTFLGNIREINVDIYTKEEVLNRYGNSGYVKIKYGNDYFKAGRIYYLENNQVRHEWEAYRIKS